MEFFHISVGVNNMLKRQDNNEWLKGTDFS